METKRGRVGLAVLREQNCGFEGYKWLNKTVTKNIV